MKNKKEELPHAVKSKEGVMLTENEQIIKRYGEYFENLLTTTNKRTKLPENKQVVNKIEGKFTDIMEKAKKQPLRKTELEVMQKIVSGLKKGKSKRLRELEQ